MAFAVKYRTETYTGLDGYDWRTAILLDGYGGSVNPSGYVLRPAGRSHSRCVWDAVEPNISVPDEYHHLFRANPTFTFHDTSDQIRAEVRAAAQGAYRLLMERDTGSGFDEVICGDVMKGQMPRPIKFGDAALTLNAFDGTHKLKTVPFDDALYGGSPSSETVAKALTRILEQTGYELSLKLGFNWYPFITGGPQLTGMSLDGIDFDPTPYTSPETVGLDPDTVFYCDYVLEQILAPLGLQYKRYGGFHYVRSYELQESSYFTEYTYPFDYYSAGAGSSASVSPGVAFPTTTTDEFKYFVVGSDDAEEGYNKASITYNHRSVGGSLLKEPSFETDTSGNGIADNWTRTGGSDSLYDLTTSADASDGIAAQKIEAASNTSGAEYFTAADAFADSGSYISQSGLQIQGGVGQQLRLSIDLKSVIPGGSFFTRMYAFIEVKIGSLWYEDGGAGSASQIIIGQEIDPAFRTLTIETSAIATGGALTVFIHQPVEIEPSTLGAGDGAAYDNLRFDFLVSGEIEPKATTTTITPTSASATTPRPTAAFDLGDVPTDLHTLGFKDSANSNGTHDWQRGAYGASPSGVSLHGLLGESWVNLRKDEPVTLSITNQRGENGTVDPIEIIDVPEINGVPYGLRRLSRDFAMGTSAFECTQLARSSDSVAITTEETAEVVRGGGPGASAAGNVTITGSGSVFRPQGFPLFSLSAAITAGSVSAASITAIDPTGVHAAAYDGDILAIIDAETGAHHTITVVGDVDETDTSITFNPTTLPNIPAASAIYRAQGYDGRVTVPRYFSGQRTQTSGTALIITDTAHIILNYAAPTTLSTFSGTAKKGQVVLIESLNSNATIAGALLPTGNPITLTTDHRLTFRYDGTNWKLYSASTIEGLTQDGITHDGTDTDFTGASTKVTAGDGTGSPELRANKGAAGIGYYRILSNGTSVFRIFSNASENVTIENQEEDKAMSLRCDVGGTQETFLYLDAANERVDVQKDLRTDSVEIDDVLNHDGSTAGFFGTTPAAQQTGGAQTATGTYGATEQDMLQKAYDALRTFGFLD